VAVAQRYTDVVATFGRVLLASLFILGGINKIVNYALTLAMMQKAGLEPATLLLPPTILLELGGGLLVAFGRKGAAPAALLLGLFTLVTNVIFHDFWNMSGEIAALQLSLFFKNVAIAGALFYVAARLDHRAAHHAGNR
jgi:putative oxidoreductase